MDGSMKDISKYRLDRAKEDLERARRKFEEGDYVLAANRSYYSIFHAMRAVNALDGFDSKKHSGVISHFNLEYIKNGDFPKEIARMIKEAMEIQQSSDYEDFYTASQKETEKQLKNAEYIIGLVAQFLKSTSGSDYGTK